MLYEFIRITVVLRWVGKGSENHEENFLKGS